MDLASTENKIKLRIAVCFPTSTLKSAEALLGLKRDVSSQAFPLVHRQFLLFVPVTSRFSQLKPMVWKHYRKLYSFDPKYLRMKKVLNFRDEQQCDLDDDYLVIDVCSSKELIFAVTEFETQFSATCEEPPRKSVKIDNSVASRPSTEEKKNLAATANSTICKKESKNGNEGKKSAEPKKVSEAATKESAEKREAATNSETSKPDSKVKSEAVKEAKSEVFKEEVVARSEIFGDKAQDGFKEESSVPKPSPTPIKRPGEGKNISTSVLVEKLVAETISKEPVQLVVPKRAEEAKVVIVSVSRAEETKSFSVVSDVITASSAPTPAPTPVFIPRKVSPATSQYSSSDSEGSADEDVAAQMEEIKYEALKQSFPSNGDLIFSQPKRTEVKVLFDADFSEDEDEETEFPEHGGIPKSSNDDGRSSSLVTLQAGPSSDLDSDKEGDAKSSDVEFSPPHARPANSPIPQPTEMPTLAELKESVLRAPTPVQLLRGGGRPSKSSVQRGRPKKTSQ